MPVDPTQLEIVEYPDAILRRKAAPVERVTDEVRAVAKRMIELMNEAEGVGLAAPQVGLAWRMFVADVPAGEKGRSASSVPPTATEGPRVYINPVLSHPADGIEPYEEGCLSLPGIRGEVLRPKTITITAMDAEGQAITSTASGLLARCWQHEVDHLDGILILDRMTQAFRIKNRVKVKALEREGGM